MISKNPEEKVTNWIRQLIWIYFWLLLLEGALRKWIVPQLSNPLLIVRDPVVIAIYFLAFRLRLFPRNAWIITLGSIAVLTIICTFVQLLPYIPPKSIALVAGYGFHANYLHLPLIFIIARVMRPEDLRKFGWSILLLLIPMSLLLVAQFRASPEAFVNRTAGGEGEMMTATLGKVRTAGPFSFVIGVVAYYSLATGYLLWGVLRKGTYKNWLLAAAGVCLIIGIVVSGSRSVVAACGVVMASLLVAMVLRPDIVNRFAQVLVVVVVLGLIVSRTPVFKQGLNVLTTRFTEVAEASETTVTGSVVGRFVSGFTEPFHVLPYAPFLGFGLGIGTNAGAKLLTHSTGFLLTEDEWARIFLESGPVLGMAFVFWRLVLAVRVGWLCVKAVVVGNLLPILLFSSTFLPLINGQFGQPTILGFVVFVSGLTLAALQDANVQPKSRPAPPPGKDASRVRGRSVYAERIHGSTTFGPIQTNGTVDR
jgi:hypothetical protein